MSSRQLSLLVFSFAALVTCFAATSALGAPLITGVSSAAAHGTTVTITGSGFGSKSPAAPLVWADGESGSATDFFTELLPSEAGSSYNTAFRSTIRGEAQAHSRSTRYLTGAHYPGTGSTTGYNVSAYIYAGAPLSRTFVSFSYKVDTRFADPLSFTFNDNYKLLTFQNNSTQHYAGCGTGCSYWYWSNYGVSEFIWKSPFWTAKSKTDGSGTSSMYGSSWTHVPGNWTKLEFEGRHATSGNGAGLRAYANGTKIHDVSGYNEPFSVYGVGIGGFFRPYGHTDLSGVPVSWRYFDDIYIDTTWARVMIGNASTWTASTVREPQIPLSWSSTSITVKINQGRIASLGQAYLYVVDSSGAVNSSGFPLCSTCPNAPTNVRVQ